MWVYRPDASACLEEGMTNYSSFPPLWLSSHRPGPSRPPHHYSITGCSLRSRSKMPYAEALTRFTWCTGHLHSLLNSLIVAGKCHNVMISSQMRVDGLWPLQACLGTYAKPRGRQRAPAYEVLLRCRYARPPSSTLRVRCCIGGACKQALRPGVKNS